MYIDIERGYSFGYIFALVILNGAIGGAALMVSVPQGAHRPDIGRVRGVRAPGATHVVLLNTALETI